YRVDRKIGVGGFGLPMHRSRIGEEVALKLIYIGSDYPQVLRVEKETYDTLSGGVGIPRVRWYGQECDFYVLVHDLLGPSLEDLFNYCGRTFSLKTILLLAERHKDVGGRHQTT
ncbi:casein kinase I isoform delta, partial [Diplogelasinospora grovesii]